MAHKPVFNTAEVLSILSGELNFPVSNSSDFEAGNDTTLHFFHVQTVAFL